MGRHAERWRGASAALGRALELTGEGRETFLADLRGSDPALADEVTRLLDAHRALDAAGFLDKGPDLPAPTSGLDAPGPVGPSDLPAGHIVGPYRIVSLLGRGGMGTVYEADELESGRRVALKILSDRLDDAAARERFEREGRLAASLDHRHCVYVFAAVEIAGTPAIAMELMQATLADRLKAHGPLPPAAAVDVAMQLASGLREAAAVGILHRDVKPANCFIDAEGVVKIGDFGISRSLRAADETTRATHGRFAATPGYASPEQLRGADLDLRADIYSLGATLYELLTGRRPLERPDLMSLLMAVANDRPAPPHALSPAVPAGLSRVVLRCLAKPPGDRFADYDALMAALAPFGSAAATPSTLGRRLAAGLIDHGVQAFANAPLVYLGFDLLGRRETLWPWQGALLLVLLAYFAIPEALWRATPGKALLGLRIVDRTGQPPPRGRIVLRAAVYVVLFSLPGLVLNQLVDPDRLFGLSPGMSLVISLGYSLLPIATMGVLFATARRHNGYAAVHDWLTGLRVVERRHLPRRAPRPASPRPTMSASSGATDVGGFVIADRPVDGLPATWREGVDQRLRRPVWVRISPPETPAVPRARASLMRPTRLRWLAGRRTSDDAWDVFERPAGQPIGRSCATPPSWPDVRVWLLDLAREWMAQTPDDRATWRLDRIWILESGHAKLVDDPIVDGAPAATSAGLLLREVVRCARRHATAPWPLGAHRFIEDLDADRLDPPAIVARLEATPAGPGAVSRGRRVLSLATQAGFPVATTVTVTIVMSVLIGQYERLPLDDRMAAAAVQRLHRAERGRAPLSVADREALEAVLATTYRPVLESGRLSDPRQVMLMLTPEERQFAAALAGQPRRAVAPPPRPSPVLTSLEFEIRQRRPPPLAFFAAMMVGTGFFFVGVGALLTSVAFRGGLMRLLGLEVVTSDGRPASRRRIAVRTLIAWLSVFLGLALTGVSGDLGIRTEVAGIPLAAMSLGVVVLVAGAMMALLRPDRGVQDLVTGTWLVPR